MTLNITAKSLLSALLLSAALTACSSQESAETAAKGEHAEEAAEHAIKSSSAGLPDGRVAEGEKLANSTDTPSKQSCIECHGKEGAAPIDPTYPTLAGQYADYLEYAITSYRDGRRDQAVMKGQVGHLNDQQVADLAAYFASRKGNITDLSHVE
ncbi:cytochrome c [Luteimonas sp. FXH3W]|uniref:Cytochrome c n=1 Tax=Aquilutibacter rugosus TaxID=3115820 RepID=A0ABU7V2A9_9GAMM